MRKPRPWFTPMLLAMAVMVGNRTVGVLALPHEVVPMPRTTDALSLTLYVKSSMGDAHFVAIPSSAKAVANSVTANDVVEPSRNDVFKDKSARNGSFPVRASERSAYVIDGLACGEAYDVFFVIEAANSNGLFSPVGRVLGVSTNGAAPPISSLSVVPVDARTNATRISLVMDAPGNPCRVWYTVLPLRDAVLLHVEDFSAEEIVERASADESVVDLPQGLKGERSPGQIRDGLESNTWYQVSAVVERAEGVFSDPVYAKVKTHREPARVMEVAAQPVQGSTDSVALLVRLDCSSAPIISEACGLLSYKVTETPPNGSPEHVKPRQVTQGTVVVMDGRAVSHHISGLSPGKAHSVTMTVEAPGSNGAFGPSLEVASTTFPRAPKLGSVEVLRCAVEPSTVTVRYKLSEPGIIHVSLAERVGHPLAMREAIMGNQHGVSFSREVGVRSGGGSDEEDSETAVALEGSQKIYDLAAGSAFDVTARSESILSGRQSGVYGVSTSRVVEAVPPVLEGVRARPPDTTTTELVVGYAVRGTSGTLYYAVAEVDVTTKGGKDSPTKSAETVMSAVQGQAGIVLAGSTVIFPSTDGISSSDDHRDAGEAQTGDQLRFQGLKPSGQYVVSLCTESNSGIFSKVVVIDAGTHAEAPLVASATVTPADRSAEALSLAVALESAGLVHFVVRRASKDAMKMNDHTIVYKMTREVNTTVVASSPPSQQGLPRRAAEGAAVGGVAFLETVDGLEPNATYEVFIATETTNSNGVYRAKNEPLIASTHPVPPPFQDVRARAADASSSTLIVTVSLLGPAEVHYAVFPTTASKDRARQAFPVTARPLQTNHGGDTEELGTGLELEEGEEEKGGGYHGIGCDNATVSNRGPSALNESIGLVTSGVVPSAFPAGSGLTEGARKATPVAGAAAMPSTEGQMRLPWKLEAGGELEAVFRVEGLQAATVYDICLFTETPGSNGLFGEVHQLRGVSTHTPVPELASEKVVCTLDCVGLNRDPCWLEENKCGECFEGFVGKAGHVNSPCGKVSSLTEADIARIAERERQDRIDEGRNQLEGLAKESLSSTADEEVANETVLFPQFSDAQDGAERKGAASARPDAIASDGSISRASQGGKTVEVTGSEDFVEEKLTSPATRLLLGVPVPTGPNVTKFLYVEVSESHRGGGGGQGNHGGNDGNASARSGPGDFDAKTAAVGLCAGLRKEGEEPPTCLTSLAAALKMRLNNGRFHAEDDAERPVLQVEVDAPGGESLAFMLRHGEDAGSAAVGFCRDNQGHLPDEQACVIMLMKDMPLPARMWDVLDTAGESV